MPAVGTDALHPARVFRGSARIAPHRLPVIQQTIRGLVGRKVVRIIPVRHRGRTSCTIRNGTTIGILRGAQVLPHPALTVHPDRTIRVSIYVGERRSALTRMSIQHKLEHISLRRKIHTADRLAFHLFITKHHIALKLHHVATLEGTSHIAPHPRFGLNIHRAIYTHNPLIINIIRITSRIIHHFYGRDFSVLPRGQHIGTGGCQGDTELVCARL